MTIFQRWGSFWPFFAVLLVGKLVLMGLFSSDYDEKMFLPFAQAFLAAPDANPYEAFLAAHGYVAFPYPPVMLAVESVACGLAGLAGGSLFWSRLLFKLPLLAFDLLGLYFLLRLYPHRRRYIGVLYFASPIMIYATEMHGQIDVIPTTLLLGAVVFLFERQRYGIALSAVFMALALLAKLHILAAVPLFLLYFQKKGEWRQMAMFLVIVLGLCAAVIAPFSGGAFWDAVLFNHEQSLLTQVSVRFVDLELYLPILALAFVYLQAYMVRNFNHALFLSFCGLLFSVFLILVPPMPGWYVWVVPYLTIFFINVDNNRYKHLAVCAALDACYLAFFVTAHATQWVDLYFGTEALTWLKIGSATYRNVLFTLLTGSLAYIIYALYHYGITGNRFYRRMAHPFAIGIAGDSGAGKSTLREILQRALGRRQVLFLEGDGDHRWERGAEMWDVYTQLNPKGSYLYRQAHDIAALRRGASVHRVDYDHTTGRFTAEHRILPRQYIVLSGLHAFYLPQMRQVLDLTVYMDTDETLRRYWKIQRDTTRRNYTPAAVLAQIEARLPDAEKYIRPQKAYADLVIEYFDETLTDCMEKHHEVCLSLRFTMSSSIDLELVLRGLAAGGVRYRYDFSQDLTRQTIVMEGASLDHAAIDFPKLMNAAIPYLTELTDEVFDGKDVREGILETMLLLVISHKMRT